MIADVGEKRVDSSRRLGNNRDGMWTLSQAVSLVVFFSLTLVSTGGQPVSSTDSSVWPGISNETRPWTYWWWMASAVEKTNITRQLEQFRDAGLGGVHIIPIYGAKGFEEKYVPYLSPKWLEMLAHTVKEARRLGMDADMTTGSGWCFGGPLVSDRDANAMVQVKRFEVSSSAPITNRFDPAELQCVVASGAAGQTLDLASTVTGEGVINWTPPNGKWQCFVVSQRPSGQKVKRAGPGGQGHMLNLFYADAVKNYVNWFAQAFARYEGPKPRAMYHDSYEYRSDWSPDLFAKFAQLRGYRLEQEIPVLFGKGESERLVRVRTDYRETLSDLMVDHAMPIWVEWSHRCGFITRNEAHGAPGNWLDLYALADIPETEMFHTDRNILVSKFASSAAHVAGRRLTSAETGTWLKEHFKETLADMKYLLDDLFLSGVNHVVYHGTCYSPEEAPWPGWLFYASYEMNPRNSVWRDVEALNAYATRCQSVLQGGTPDNDLLVYWPIHDFWNNATGLVRNMSVHARDWFEGQPIGQTAAQLWQSGYAFDFITDRQLQRLRVERGIVTTEMPPGFEGAPPVPSRYRAILVPPTETMPEKTLEALLRLAEAGATVIFERQLPQDVPGWGRLEERRAQFRQAVNRVHFPSEHSQVKSVGMGQGRILVGDLKPSLEKAEVLRERLSDRAGLMSIRRLNGEDQYYFLANRSESTVAEWIPVAKPGSQIYAMDPLNGEVGLLSTKQGSDGTRVWLRLPPGASIILRCSDKLLPEVEPWRDWQTSGIARQLTGSWSVRFLSGGPTLPQEFRTTRLGSWTETGAGVSSPDPALQKFAGTASYRLEFDFETEGQGPWVLDLGQVCQSARVRLNGEELGTLIVPPFRVVARKLKKTSNILEVEVTNVSANRIRALDLEGVKWKNFQDINFVDINYRPFDASGWPLTESGLIGPVTVTPVGNQEPGK